MTDPRASGHTFKPIHDVLVVLGLAFLLLIFLLFRPGDIKVVPPEPDPSSAVDIIVDEKPLTVPDEFKKTLQGLDIAGIILVNDEAQLRLIDPNGKPIDPCGPKSKGSAGSWTCKYAAIPKTFALRASGNTQLLSHLFRPSDIKVVPPEPDPSSVEDIIVDEKPLTVPDEFKKTLQGLDIAGIILVNDEAQLRLIDPNGKPIDPCGPKPRGSVGSWACKYAATPKTFALRASGNTQLLSQCGRCRDAVGINHSCHRPRGTGKGRYDCPDPHPFLHERCDTRCE